MDRSLRAALIAQRQLCRALRARPPSLRAILPFDPADGEDVQCWALAQMARFSRPPASEAYAAQRVIWNGLSQARMGKARCSVCATDLDASVGARGGPAGYSDRRATAQQAGQCALDEIELAEELAAAAAETAHALQRSATRSPGRLTRYGVALLRCLIRVAHMVSLSISDDAVARFRLTLTQHRSYRTLRIDLSSRQRFEDALMKLKGLSGNLRQDLMRVEFAAPSSRSWREFARALERRIRHRLGRDAA